MATPLIDDAPSIRRLDTALINQIAAGEVVVRPSAAVKELVENSLDAGATRIEIHVEEDARSFSVRDDGRGMSRADAELAVERYATSKIRRIEDLMALSTRGFRGEALAAISAVSRFEILTRRAEDDAGTRLTCEGGTPPRIASAGAPPGTFITIRDLFYNTPARLKFLRTPVAEWGYMLKEIVRQALTRPDVAFSVWWRGRPFLTLPGGQSLRERLSGILPGEASGDLIEVDATVQGVRAFGCIGSPKSTRRDRRHQYFFANGRPIIARPFAFALQEAYRGLIMTQQFPVGAVFLEVPPDMVDVNVHPTKDEVRFQNESLASGAIHRAALEAMRKADLVPRLEMPATPGERFARAAAIEPRGTGARYGGAMPGVFAGESKIEEQPEAVPTEAQRDLPFERPRALVPESVSDNDPGSVAPSRPADPRLAYTDKIAEEEATLIRRLVSAVPGARPRALAQIELTYILAEAQGLGLLLVDQHAAHEKILYLKFMSRPEGRDVQDLLIPFQYEAGVTEAAAIEAIAPAMAAEGFTVEPFGGGTFLIQSVPVIFDRIDLSAFMRDLIDDMGRGEFGRELAGVRHRIGARAACRAAVMAGDPLSLPEMQALLDQVLETEGALRCPHGRPTMLLLGKDQLDRQFGRI